MSVCETDVTKLAYVGTDSDNFLQKWILQAFNGQDRAMEVSYEVA